MYRELSEITGQNPDAFHFDNFELRDGKLYYRDKSTPLTIRGERLRSVSAIEEILGKAGLRDLGFDIPVEGKLTARQVIMLNKLEEELPRTSDLAKEDDTELQELQRITEKFFDANTF